MMTSAMLLVAVVAITSGTVSGYAGLPHRARGGIAGKLPKHQVSLRETATQYWIDLPVDHSDPTVGTYKNKYYVDTTYFSEARPVCFFMMGGEGPLGGIGEGFFAHLAKKHGALMVAIEHRFYGDSDPLGGLAFEHFKYLTVDQALDDASELIEYLNPKYSSKGCAWFTFGGSYSGALSAWFREKHPENTLGSLSSSGVVNAILNFTEFDTQVATAAGPVCAKRIQEVTRAFELNDNAAAREMFGSPSNMSSPDFFYMLADSAAMGVQYGHKKNLCDAVLAPTNPMNATLMKTFADFTNNFWGKSFGSNCFYDSECLLHTPARWKPTSISWRYQKCSQLAYLQAAPAVNSLRSSKVSLDQLTAQCSYVFKGLPQPPPTAATNAEFGGVHPNATRIFFSDFSDDPWQQASVRSSSSDLPYHMVNCNGCGHCDDFSTPSLTDPLNLTLERDAFQKMLTQWLSSTPDDYAMFF